MANPNAASSGASSGAASAESFGEFKNSFCYGTRSDLLFKFLQSLPGEDAAEFLRVLLRRVGQAADDGDLAPLVEHVYSSQVRAYEEEGAHGFGSHWSYDDGPFAPLRRPVASSRVALLTSSGHFVAGDDPQPFGVEAMTQEEAESRILEFLCARPELSSISRDTPDQELRVRHGGYDVRAARADPNVAFPLARMRELAAAGKIGELAGEAYSFVGAASQLRLRKEALPPWIARLQSAGVEAALLVPV